jgi:hypothetical protein
MAPVIRKQKHVILKRSGADTPRHNTRKLMACNDINSNRNAKLKSISVNDHSELDCKTRFLCIRHKMEYFFMALPYQVIKVTDFSKLHYHKLNRALYLTHPNLNILKKISK